MANPFYIRQANPMQGLNSMLGASKTILTEGKQQVAENEKQDIRQQANDLFQSGTPEEINAFAAANPWIVEERAATGKNRGELTKQSVLQTARDILLNNVDPSIAFTDSAKRAHEGGASAKDSIEMARQSKEDPQKGVRAAEIALALYGESGDLAAYRKAAGSASEADIKVGSQEILEDGTIIQSTSAGPVVFNSLGVKVSGQEAKDAVATARATKVSNLRAAAGGKRAAALEEELRLKGMVEANIVSAKAAANASLKAFEKVEKIHTNIANLHEVGRLIDEGAETGAIAKRMPSFRKSSVMLENLQAGLGLDVLHSTTFGALSEKELAFALSTALPVGLEGPALKEWATRKIESQEKLADYLESAAMYLGTPGNTAKGWVEYQRNKSGDKYGRTQALPEGVTEDQLTFTMDKYKMTREQVLSRLAGK